MLSLMSYLSPIPQMDNKPLLIDKKTKDKVDAIEAMPRKERRRLGREIGVKIPGSSKPYVKPVMTITYEVKK